MSKRDRRHLYFRDRKAYRNQEKVLGMMALPKSRDKKKTSSKLKINVGDTVIFDPLPEAWTITTTASALDTDLDWRTDNLDTLMEAAMAGDSLPTRTAQSLLLEAAEIVSGDRERTHGKKERSFEVIADFWDTYLTGRVDRATGRVTALDVAQMMVLLKIARTIQGEPVWDHFIDAAGYSGVAGEIYASMKGTSHGPK